MGFWKKFGSITKQVVSVAVNVAPVLPIPDRAKQTVQDVGQVETDVEKVIADVKPPKPAA